MSREINAENVMRKNNKKGKIIFAVVFFSVLLLLELVFAFNYLNFMQNEVSSGIGVVDFARSTMSPFQNVTLSLSGKTIKAMFGCVLSVWWLNLIAILFLVLLVRKKGNFAGMEHGSARWLSAKEKKEFYTEKQSGVIPVANDIFIDPKNHRINNLNELVLGSSGSGKSFTKLIPDIMYQFGSYVITDVKGDLYKFLNKILIKNGYKVRVLNLNDLKYSNSFNPIVYCESDTDIDKLINTFVINSRREGTSAGESFWEDTLSMLLFAAVKYISQTETEQKTFYRCLQLASSIELVNGNVSPFCEMERIMVALEQEDPFSSAVLNWKLVKQAPAETLQSVIISLTSRLRLWANEDLRILTQTDEMDFDGLCREKTAIFLIVPEGDRTYNCISSMFISTAVQRLKTIAKEKYDGSLPRLVSFELDEFANTGVLPNWADAVSTFRSQNIRALMILQDLQQLKKNYDKSEKTIMSNCAIFNYLGTTEEDTIKMVSKRLGATTITGQDSSYSSSGGLGTGKNNISERGMARSLMKEDELANKPKDKSIVFLEGYRPMYVDKFKTRTHPLFSLLGNNTGSHTVNNTILKAEYSELYEKHRHEYLKQIDKLEIDLFSDEDLSGDVREQQLNNNQIIPTEETEQDIEKAFERQFLEDLKALNK